jgi:4'-phosphopantetheinyl transferase
MSDSAHVPKVATYWRQRECLEPRDRTLLIEAAARFANCAPSDLFVSSFCPHCAGTDHGIPSVCYVTEPSRQEQPDRPPLPRVSLSRSGNISAVALAVSGLIGVDVERVSRIAAADIDAVAFHKEERRTLERIDPSEKALHRTVLWAAKEAILKSVGTGLMISPELLHLDMRENSARLVSWPTDLKLRVAPELTVRRIDEHHVCVVAHDEGALTTFSSWPTSPVLPS